MEKGNQEETPPERTNIRSRKNALSSTKCLRENGDLYKKLKGKNRGTEHPAKGWEQRDFKG